MAEANPNSTRVLPTSVATDFWNVGKCCARKESPRQSPRAAETLHHLHVKTSSTFVPPSKWGINRSDLKFFEKEVKSCYKNEQISAEPEQSEMIGPRPAGKRQRSTGYDNPMIGPSMYEVVTDYVKPYTKAKEGMSWALTRRPEGLLVDCFATHAWIEGVFEFITKIGQVWPHGTNSLYICFLGNPQFGVAQLLTDNIKDSPFYLALTVSKHMIVIPNSNSSIYTRKWCVYEAHLALELTETHDMKITLPWLMSKRTLAIEVAPAILFGVAGFFIGLKLISKHVQSLCGPVMWLLIAFVLCYGVGRVVHRLGHVSLRSDGHASADCVPANDKDKRRIRFNRLFMVTQALIFYEYIESFVICLGAGLSWAHFVGPVTQTSHVKVRAHALLRFDAHGKQWQDGEEVSCCMVLWACLVMCLYKILLTLIKKIATKNGGQLHFESVAKAECSSQKDSDTIDSAIEGKIENIDRDVLTLINIGRFDRSIRRNILLGMKAEVAADGINPAKIIFATIAWQFWWVTDLAGRDQLSLAFCIPILSSIALCGAAFRIGDMVVFSIDAFLTCGTFFLLLSNHSQWFNHEAVVHLSMSHSSLLLQFVCALGMIPLNAFHYYGYRARWIQWSRQHLWLMSIATDDHVGHEDVEGYKPMKLQVTSEPQP